MVKSAMLPLPCAADLSCHSHSEFTIIGDLAASTVFHCRRHFLPPSSSVAIIFKCFGDVFIAALSSRMSTPLRIACAFDV